MNSRTSLWLDTHRVSAPVSGPLPTDAQYDTVVAGAGLTGLTTAVLLARAGQRVAVLEARSVGAAATGNTTAKLSLLQGTVLSEISRHQSEEVLRSYVAGNREGQAWLLRYLEDYGIPVERRTAYTYATSKKGVSSLRAELEACRTAGLPAAWTEETELPFPVAGAIALEEQAQFHPMQVLDALATELVERGGALHEGVRVTGAGRSSPLTVRTSAGTVRATRLVLATGVPVLDRGGHFAQLSPQRSYAQSYRVPGPIPQGMYLSADSPSRSLRTADDDGGQLLLVGGNDHVVGRTDSERRAVEDLEEWTQRHFPGARRTHAWSAQDYRPAHRVPFVGVLPRGGGNILLATGYQKWGMTNAVSAALQLSTHILGGRLDWAARLRRVPTTPADLLTGLKDNAAVGAHLVGDWARAGLRPAPEQAPAEGQGVVGRRGLRPVATSTVDGVTCAVSGICPHLGGVLAWNDAERTWDCPLHGSRFAADGRLLEGPAVADLDPAGLSRPAAPRDRPAPPATPQR
ncbi:FAD-dependent oxidoreductase [Micrococcus luteus]|jgi:glycine/D-amino acid oxidase-like deaminating enzyme/nitrite reductase/ring-hydroxylating ferredoxin subunit|uniref:Cytochrome b6-f complex iron-sulfur subunit 1 n=1 Tax=Micrococcus luteus (strain ATCC 4698 / DSM 20030 / JCM 1464 / CCM 169 / CCUG 5858 / IAM 1056 / NBRC 3333 / NCIMB 9278 / NCTC 2665 / VKM Ac-2230) TaxID=465515 RepID=C5C7P1_MICLC|nr:FAD-dependent oxidoreductase [Micrococcus luteus]ACS31729.1 glycine/D-amino acid oxidase, deaminating [Micrococcus luteus NCTC 2665]AJO56773.1 FAD-dependent oxidoreductase [Micrococcus luteus]KAB1901689.1 FAD-dependent oxidoreductase [Micrococcus luteus NCTC 2665]ORE59797.1 FAD-dependent oxidoreductase [Micrococcus luteus]QCY44470.1 FAD-dependent oxidoreductase [Micrococcus luteus]